MDTIIAIANNLGEKRGVVEGLTVGNRNPQGMQRDVGGRNGMLGDRPWS